MTVNQFQLSTKCPLSCFKCIIEKKDNKREIITKIKSSPKGCLNFFFNHTIDNIMLDEINKVIVTSQQKAGFFYNGLQKEEYLKYNPSTMVFPLFSMIPEKHNLITGKPIFHQTLSTINSLPKTIKKAVIFFVTKENLSETTDLANLALALKTTIYIQPLCFYSPTDFDKETIRYLKRINKQRKIKLLPIGNNPQHCKNWAPKQNFSERIYNISKFWFFRNK